MIAGAIVARRAGADVLLGMDMVAPGLILAQAIGRLGNWFNQELYGKPSDLPWALEIDREHRPEAYADTATFHPTFLYELLWNLVVLAVLLAVGRRLALRPPALFCLYVASSWSCCASTPRTRSPACASTPGSRSSSSSAPLRCSPASAGEKESVPSASNDLGHAESGSVRYPG